MPRGERYENHEDLPRRRRNLLTHIASTGSKTWCADANTRHQPRPLRSRRLYQAHGRLYPGGETNGWRLGDYIGYGLPGNIGPQGQGTRKQEREAGSDAGVGANSFW